MRSEPDFSILPWRCNVTGNPVGTDTRMIGAPPCDCQGCRAANLLASKEAEIERLTKALTECAAEWRSPPTTIGGALEYVSAEFKRRMQVAADALTPLPEGGQ